MAGATDKRGENLGKERINRGKFSLSSKIDREYEPSQTLKGQEELHEGQEIHTTERNWEGKGPKRDGITS